ncbi:MAG: tetratricopeptide repeat protein [Syntrophaceae bacterium]
MKMRKFHMSLAGLLILIFLSGCAVSESYKTGQDLSKRNQWDDAIGYYEKALEEDPNNREYKNALQKAKQEAAKIHYGKAKSAFARVPDPNIPELDLILKESNQAYVIDPDNNEIRGFHESLREKKDALNKMIKALYSQAEVDMQKEDWMTALTKLKQVNKIFPNYEDTSAKIVKIEQEGTKLFYQHGIAFSKQDDWKMAAQAFKAAMDINPNYYDVKKLYNAAISKDNANYFITEAEKAEKGEKWDRAIFMYKKAAEYQPENKDLLTKMDNLKSKIGDMYFNDAAKLVHQGKLFGASKKLEIVKTYKPSAQNEQSYKDLMSKLCGMLMDRADDYHNREMWGNAFTWYQKVDALNPSYSDLFQKVLEAKDNINKRIKKSIAVFDFDSPSNNKDAGKIAANKLITYLHKNASGDLRIIERENLQSILREMQLGQTGIVDVKSVQTVKMRGIDTFIMGNVLNFSSKFTDNKSTNQAVMFDEEDVSNPEYIEWLVTHQRPSESERKSAPSRTIKKRTPRYIPYTQGIAKISAMIEISYKLVNTTTGENIFTNTISGRLVKEDKYQDGVAPANIPQDPLELPTESEVLDELTNEKVSEMGKSVLKHYQSLEVEYFNEGEQQRIKRRNPELAVERYTDALFDEKSKGIKTPITLKSLELIDHLLQNR